MLTYSELILRSSFLSRFRYAMLEGSLGVETFGFDRYLNQKFYGSYEWRQSRDQVRIRDDGNDLGVPGMPIMGKMLVHHMNPLKPEDLVDWNEDRLFNPEYLITVSHQTHNAIHFSDERQLPTGIIERRPGDTKLW